MMLREVKFPGVMPLITPKASRTPCPSPPHVSPFRQAVQLAPLFVTRDQKLTHSSFEMKLNYTLTNKKWQTMKHSLPGSCPLWNLMTSSQLPGEMSISTPYVSPMESFFLIRFDFVICRTCTLFKRQNHMYTCSDDPIYLSLVPQTHSPASCR